MSKFLSFFQRSLARRPILTNTCVYATFYSLAELSQQSFNKHFTEGKPDYDFGSAVRIVGVGSCLYAPTLTIWFRFLDTRFPGKATRNVLTKVACDQFIMTPFLMAVFYSALGFLEGGEDMFAELKSKYIKTFIANQCFWLPGQTINFAFLPPRLRVVYVAACSFIWINVLCFIKRQKVEENLRKD